jgi:fructose-1,6-bisphosphatase II / sedoheptulose-1,7-bisphosphatase
MLNRILTIEIARVTEAAAIAAASLRGRGNEKQADQLAVDAMRTALNGIEMDGMVVIGEGERDEAPMLYIGEKVGSGKGPKIDIALDPLEGTTLCAKAMPDSLAVIAMAEGGSLLHAPDSYMSKIAIGPGYPDGVVDLDADPADNIKALAKAKGVEPSQITACILDRPRHAELIAKVREAGAGIRLITDGDVAGVIHTTDPDNTGIDIYMGVGGAPEGVLAAAALRCIGGQMQGRLVFNKPDDRERAKKMGVKDPDAKFSLTEMASGDVMFAATGVTDGRHVVGREVWCQPHHHRHRGHALGHRHGALDQEPQKSVTSPAKAFLNVERSVTGRRWVPRLETERIAEAISQQAG